MDGGLTDPAHQRFVQAFRAAKEAEEDEDRSDHFRDLAWLDQMERDDYPRNADL